MPLTRTTKRLWNWQECWKGNCSMRTSVISRNPNPYPKPLKGLNSVCEPVENPSISKFYFQLSFTESYFKQNSSTWVLRQLAETGVQYSSFSMESRML